MHRPTLGQLAVCWSSIMLGGWFTWHKTNGAATRIDVDEDGVPWVIGTSGRIFKRRGVSGSNILGTSWVVVGDEPPGGSGGSVSDLAVARGSAWIGGSWGVRTHQQQVGFDTDMDGDFLDDNDAVPFDRWALVYKRQGLGTPSRVAVGTDARPWAISGYGGILWGKTR